MPRTVIGCRLGSYFAITLWDVIFGDREDDRDWLQLCDHRQRIGVGGVNDISLVDQPQADSSGKRRMDAAISDVHVVRLSIMPFVCFNGTLILIHQSCLRIDLGLRDGKVLLFQQDLDTERGFSWASFRSA